MSSWTPHGTKGRVTLPEPIWKSYHRRSTKIKVPWGVQSFSGNIKFTYNICHGNNKSSLLAEGLFIYFLLAPLPFYNPSLYCAEIKIELHLQAFSNPSSWLLTLSNIWPGFIRPHSSLNDYSDFFTKLRSWNWMLATIVTTLSLCILHFWQIKSHKIGIWFQFIILICT